MSIPANYPLRLTPGRTESVPVIYADEATGAAINLSGYTFAAQVRATAASTSVLAEFTCAVVGDGSTGQAVCTLPASATAQLTPGVAVWDLIATHSGVVDELVKASAVIIEQGVTR